MGGLKYTRAAQDEDSLEGYVDADYAGNVDKRKSLSGFVFTLYGTVMTLGHTSIFVQFLCSFGRVQVVMHWSEAGKRTVL